MESLFHEFQSVLTALCFFALAASLFAIVVIKALPEVTNAIHRFIGLDRFGKVVCVLCIVGAVMYGGSKSIVVYDGGIARDPSNENVCSNSTVEVYWIKEPSSMLPNEAVVYIDYRITDTTNEWVNIGQSTVGAGFWSGTVENATNYDYQVWAYYIPPEPVHTNGVWSYSTMRDKRNVGIIPLRADVEADGSTILEPRKNRGGQ